jgi:hypothetical protein
MRRPPSAKEPAGSAALATPKCAARRLPACPPARLRKSLPGRLPHVLHPARAQPGADSGPARGLARGAPPVLTAPIRGAGARLRAAHAGDGAWWR